MAECKVCENSFKLSDLSLSGFCPKCSGINEYYDGRTKLKKASTLISTIVQMLRIIFVFIFLFFILLIILVITGPPLGLEGIELFISLLGAALVVLLVERHFKKSRVEEKVQIQNAKNAVTRDIIDSLINKKTNENNILNVLSLKTPDIKVQVIGHTKRTLELRCGYVITGEEPVSITLIKKHTGTGATNEKEGEKFVCSLPNAQKCRVVIKHKIINNDVEWIATTFFPINEEDWFKFCIAEDTALKDDKTLSSIDRIVWHEKLLEKIEKKLKDIH